MHRSFLLKRLEGVELWTAISDRRQNFAVKMGERRARVLDTLIEAEAYFAATLSNRRAVRAD